LVPDLNGPTFHRKDGSTVKKLLVLAIVAGFLSVAGLGCSGETKSSGGAKPAPAPATGKDTKKE
jgi:hypothetical protein